MTTKSVFNKSLILCSVFFFAVLFLFSSNQNATANFLEAAKVTDPNGLPGDEFGREVSIQGDLAIVGVPLAEIDGETDRGKAFIYERAMDGTWTEVAELDPEDTAMNDRFGRCVSIYGTFAFVGASRQGRGMVYVYERIGGFWVEVDKLAASDAQNGDRFGRSCAIYDNTAIIGALRANPGGMNNAGQAYIFELDGFGDWQETQILSASDGEAQARFGRSVGITENFVIVGAVEANGAEMEQGKAYIYDNTGGGMFINEKILVPSDPETGANFGISVGISSSVPTGLTAIVGADRASSGGNNRGQAYVFQPDGGFVWSETQILISSNQSNNDRFGLSVSISGERALVGSPRAEPNNTGQGFLFLWDGLMFAEDQVLLGSDSLNGDRFGESVFIDNNHAIVGAPLDDSEDPMNNVDRGSAYIFEASGTLTIIKETVPAGGTDFDFTGTGFPTTCPLDGSFSLDHAMALGCPLLPNTYTVEEMVPEGFELTDITCTGASSFSTDATSATIDVMSFENITCTFTNTEIFNLSVTLEGDGDGTVTSAPAGINCGEGNVDCDEDYLSGQMVTLTAVPDAVSSFAGFTGDADCEDGIVNIVDSDVNCIATFDFLPLILNPIFPGVASNPNIITVEQASPGGQVAYLWGFMPGSTIVGGPTCNGIEIGMNDPRLLGIISAGGDQVANLVIYIPLSPIFENPVLVQAVDIPTCRTSDVVANIILNE